ncbi:MAG: hypothetical protein ACRDMA_17865 [Solirubrobacterales bacterium]
MQGKDEFARFVQGGFELLGIDADETELAVIEVAGAIYQPHIDALLAADLDAVEAEPHIDLARPPR